MQVVLRKTLKSQWYQQLIMVVLVGLLMASIADAETKQDDTLYDEWPQLVGKWGPMMKLRDNISTWSPDRKPPGGWWVGPIHATLLSDGQVILTGFSRREEKRVYFGHDQKHTSLENGISFVLDRSHPTKSQRHIVCQPSERKWRITRGRSSSYRQARSPVLLRSCADWRWPGSIHRRLPDDKPWTRKSRG